MPTDTSSNEKHLVQRAQQGNADAFIELYHHYAPLIYRYFLFRTSNSATAEDLTSEVFVRLVKSLQNYRDQGLPFSAWLFRIARARAVDHHRYQARRPIEMLSDQFLDPQSDPEGQAERRIEIAHLTRAIALLTDEQQMVIQLRFVEGYTLEETAQTMQKTVGAVKAMQHRALQNLIEQAKHDT